MKNEKYIFGLLDKSSLVISIPPQGPHGPFKFPYYYGDKSYSNLSNISVAIEQRALQEPLVQCKLVFA